MAFIVYNLTDPSNENRKTDYVVVADTEEEAKESFDTAVEDLKLGEGFYLVEVDMPRGKLTEDVIEQGIQSEWAHVPAEILYAVDNYFSDEATEDWGLD